MSSMWARRCAVISGMRRKPCSASMIALSAACRCCRPASSIASSAVAGVICCPGEELSWRSMHRISSAASRRPHR